jgi:hypothetical protein
LRVGRAGAKLSGLGGGGGLKIFFTEHNEGCIFSYEETHKKSLVLHRIILDEKAIFVGKE